MWQFREEKTQNDAYVIILTNWDVSDTIYWDVEEWRKTSFEFGEWIWDAQ